MSIKIKYNQNLMVLLKSIFYEHPTEVDEFLPLVKDAKNIPNIVSFSLSMKIENHVDKSNGISLIFYLQSLFNHNPDLIPLFNEKCNKYGNNIFDSLLLPFYLHEKIEEEELTLIEEVIQKFVDKITFPKTALSFIFEQLSTFLKVDNKKKLNQKMFMRYLKLLNIFYKDRKFPANNKPEPKTKEEKEMKDIIQIPKKPIDIKNYIYFTGVNSGISLLLNKASNNPNTDLPAIENGFTFVFWINFNKDLLNTFFDTLMPGSTVNLLRVFVGGHHIAFQLRDAADVSIIVDDNESCMINISNVINYNQWNCIIFLIEQKATKKKEPIKIRINGSQLLTTLSLPKGFNLNEKIDNIMLFENFFGKVTSFLFFSFPIEQKLIEFFESQEMTYGFYKNKILFRFLHSIDKEYYRTAINYKYFIKFRQDKNMQKIYNLNLNMREQYINNLICCFCPFTYDKSKKIIDDVFGNLYGVFKSTDDGATFYRNQIKDIMLLGGMNNILPILEVMLIGLNPKNTLIDQKLVSENSLVDYLNILKKILYCHKLNIIEANSNQFFSSLALFLEKFPSEIFTLNVLNLILDICKETLKYKAEVQEAKNKDKTRSDDDTLNYTFLSMILLNPKIISKFSPENQLKLWDGVNQFFKNDNVEVDSALNVEKIGMLLRFYDTERYSKYCCKKHAQLFGCEKDKEIMSPEMNLRVLKLFEAIQLYIDKVGEKEEKTNEDSISFYELLCLDLSPCLQKKIIQSYVFHFINVKISNKLKDRTMNILLTNHYFELTEYLLGVSLLDVRTEVLKLLQIFLVKYKDKIQEYLYSKKLNLSQIFSLISHNLLPTNLKIKEEQPPNKSSGSSSKTNDKVSELPSQKGNKSDYMYQYFNKKIYESDINSLWSSLSSSLTYNAPTVPGTSPPPVERTNSKASSSSLLGSNKKSKDDVNNKNENQNTNTTANTKAGSLFINSFVISFSIDFLMKVPDNYFIDSFLVSVYSTLNNENIANQSTVFSNKRLYPWIIDTLFYYHKKENTDKIADKNLVKEIQKHSIQVLSEVFVIKAQPKEIEDKMNYLLEFAYFKKNKYKSNPQFQNEIVKITRMVLEKIMKFQSNFNIKTIYCFEFVALSKSDQKLFERSYESCEHHKENTFTEQDLIEIRERRDTALDSEEILRKMGKKDFENYPGEPRKTECFHSKTLTMNATDNSSLSSNTASTSELLTDIALIPDYIYDSVNYVDKNDNQKPDKPDKKKDKDKDKKNYLKNIWSDYEIFNYIIKHYYMDLWGGENICKKVKVKYEKGKFFLICKDLYKLYSDNKEYKNILSKDMAKCCLFDFYGNSLPRNSVNLLNINMILLCIAVDICDAIEEREALVQSLIEFIVFCILMSVNLNQAEPAYNYYQRVLFDILGFAFMFLQQREEIKYRELVYYMINPIVEDLNDTGLQGIKKIFGSSSNKKHLLKPTAVYKLFMYSEANDVKESSSGLPVAKKEHNRKKGASGSVPPKRPSISQSTNTTDVTKLNRKNSNDKNENLNIKNLNAKNNTLSLRCNGLQVTKNIFEKTLGFYKNERTDFYLEKLLFFYEDTDFTKDPNEEERVVQENKRINIFIKQLVPSLISEIQKFSNVSYLEEKRRRNIYKKNKKKLFSWNGFWSDKDLFFNKPDKLKLKLKNHFTRDMTKIVLSAVLDQNYYIPKFSKFDTKKLYNKNDYKYNVCLDIDEILDFKTAKTDQKPKKENEIIIKNNHGFNYLECLYKCQFSGIWEKYKEFLLEDTDAESSFKPEDIFATIFQNKLSKVNEQNMGAENFYSCCMVKPTHHIKGLIRTEKTSIRFTYCPEKKELLEKDPNYDKDMGACFGSTFKMHNKDKDLLFFEVRYTNIEYMLKRTYFYQETGVEIYTYDHRSYFFNFVTNQALMKFINDILQHEKFRNIKAHGYRSKKLLGYGKLFNVYPKKKSYHVSHKSEEWQNNNISTLEYLMWCNVFSGRSYNDLTQYPVMPWIITNYETDQINPNQDYRNLAIPVGMFDMNEKAEMRKETFLDFYETLKNDLKEANPDFNYQVFLEKLDEYLEHYKFKKIKKKAKEEKTEINNTEVDSIDINQIPFLYGSHYSNPTYVSHYLTRLFPFASISIEIHGDKFDDPNRMFFSLKRTFETASTLKDDVRELIPEFYLMPEMFLNRNNFNLAQDKMDAEGKLIVINDVELPPWCQNKAIDFVIKMRKNLESYDLKINRWIDLIFGILQKGIKAEENHNLFMLNTYEDMVKIENIKDEDERNALMRLAEVGVTPHQVFGSESKSKTDKSSFISKSPIYSYTKGAFLSDSTELKFFVINSHKYNKLMLKLFENKKYNKECKEETPHQLIKLKTINQNELKIISNTNYWFNLKFNRTDNSYLIEETSLRELTNVSSKYACAYQMSSIQVPLVIYGNNRYMVKAGFWDGRVEINTLPVDSKEETTSSCFVIEEGAVVVMQMDSNETILVCGTNLGYLLIFDVEGPKLTLNKKRIFHNDEITSISINDNLNMIATASLDGYVNLLLLPNFELVRSFKLSTKYGGNLSEGDSFIYANNVFLSSSPLPCVSFYMSAKKMFRSFTINGELIADNSDVGESNEIRCPIIFNNLSFFDFLIYGTDDGFIKIRSFPEMNLINSLKPFEEQGFVSLELSPDKRYCYAWSEGDKIVVIKDISVNDPSKTIKK